MNANDQAFPAEYVAQDPENGQSRMYWEKGMTKREYIAIEMMKGLVGNSENLRFFNKADITPKEVREETAKTAVQFTDALIAELSKTEPKK